MRTIIRQYGSKKSRLAPNLAVAWALLRGLAKERESLLEVAALSEVDRVMRERG
jgi:hypothetical protein